MSYNEFLANPYHENFGIIALGIAIGFVAFVALFAWGLASFEGVVSISPKKAVSMIVTAVVGVVMMCVVTYTTTNASYAIDDQNKVIAEKNLKEKYDIQGVIWAGSLAKYNSEHGMSYIKVHDSENNILKFNYKVDKETLEPHLLNNEDNNGYIKSKDLLRSEK